MAAALEEPGGGGAALAALLPFGEVGWRAGDAERWLTGLRCGALRDALREACAVARLAAAFRDLERRAAGPPGEATGGDDDAGAAAARAWEGHPAMGVFWVRYSAAGGGGGGAGEQGADFYCNERFAALMGVGRREL
jgi:hypothetical protein